MPNWSHIAAGALLAGGALLLRARYKDRRVAIITAEERKGMLHLGIEINGKSNAVYLDEKKWYWVKTNEKVSVADSKLISEAYKVFRKTKGR